MLLRGVGTIPQSSTTVTLTSRAQVCVYTLRELWTSKHVAHSLRLLIATPSDTLSHMTMEAKADRLMVLKGPQKPITYIPNA